MKKSIVALGIVLALSGCAATADETLTAEPAALVEISPATEENAQPVEAAATAEPAQTATPVPTPEPTQAPTPAPTAEPTAVPTAEPTQAPVEETVADTPAQVGMSYGAVPFDLAAGTEQWWSIDSSDSAYWAVQENINAIRAAAGLSPLAMDGRAERGGRCPLRMFCRGRCVRPQRHDYPQRNLRGRAYRLGQQRMQLLAEQSCPLCQHHQRQLYEHGCGLLVLLHRRGAVYLLDCHIQLKLPLVFIHKL